MEVHQEEEIMMMGLNKQQHVIFKGKRTKRQRTMLPPDQPPNFLLTMAPPTTTTTTTSSCSSIGASHDSSTALDNILTSPTTTSPASDSGEYNFTHDHPSAVVVLDHEQDMANCLILLAQGRQALNSSTHDHVHPPTTLHLATVTRSSSTTNTTTYKSSSSSGAAHHDVYQCKTCNRSFSSFQALGGHRASHKKPKSSTTTPVQEKTSTVNDQQQDATHVGLMIKDIELSLQIPSSSRCINSASCKSTRVHECSICGAEFSSGQALGGHMRRHRRLPNNTLTSASSCSNDEAAARSSKEISVLVIKKKKNPIRPLLSLDLNLSAAPDAQPDDHDYVINRESKYDPYAAAAAAAPSASASSSAKEQVIHVYSSASHHHHHPLVDCHY